MSKLIRYTLAMDTTVKCSSFLSIWNLFIFIIYNISSLIYLPSKTQAYQCLWQTFGYAYANGNGAWAKGMWMKKDCRWTLLITLSYINLHELEDHSQLHLWYIELKKSVTISESNYYFSSSSIRSLGTHAVNNF